jgi:hypothetical protein
MHENVCYGYSFRGASPKAVKIEKICFATFAQQQFSTQLKLDLV